MIWHSCRCVSEKIDKDNYLKHMKQQMLLNIEYVGQSHDSSCLLLFQTSSGNVARLVNLTTKIRSETIFTV